MQKNNSEILYEISLKLLNKENLVENILGESTLTPLLLEDLEDKDVENLRKAVNDTMKAAISNQKIATNSKMPSVADYFGKIKSSLEKASQLVAQIDLEDDSGILGKAKSLFGKKVSTPRAMQAVIDLQNKSNVAAKTMANAFTLVTKNLNSLKVSDDRKLSDLTDEKDGVSAEKIKAGIAKAFNSAKPKGFMAKLGGLMGKLKLPNIPGAEDIGDFPTEKAAEELLSLTFGEFKQTGESAEKTADDAENSKVPVDVIRDVNAEAKPEKSSKLPPEAKKAEKRPDFNEEDLIKLLALAKSPVAKALKDMPEDEKKAAIEDQVEKIASGEISPEKAVAEVEEEIKNSPKWSEISKSFLDDLPEEDKEVGKSLASALKDNEEFNKKVGSSINMSESFVDYKLPMSVLLKEEVAFDDIMSAASDVIKNKNKAKNSAIGLAKKISDAGVDVPNIPEKESEEEIKLNPGDIHKYTTNKGKETFVKVVEQEGENVIVRSVDGKGGFRKNKFPLPPKKLGEKTTAKEAGVKEETQEVSADSGNAAAESDPSAKIKAVASAASSKPMSPKDAVSKALSDWEGSLSGSSQKSLKAKNRGGKLKDAVFTGIDKGKKAVQRAVAKAVKDWRSENEEVLIKSKRFAKKNFDSLQQMIPALAAQVLAQAKESRQRKLTTVEIKNFVYNRLDEKFNVSNKLFETWQKNAGLLK